MTISALIAAMLLTTNPINTVGTMTLEGTLGAGKDVILPIHVKSGFAFIRGRVNGTAGDFMFDTGTPFSLFLNRAFLKLPEGKEISHGSASSGQKITVIDQGCIESARLGPHYALSSLCDTRSADLGFVQTALNSELLGFVGVGLIRDFKTTLDLPRQRLIISTDRLSSPDEAKPLTVIHFPPDQQLPHFDLTSGEVKLDAHMDTGDLGHVTLTQGDADKLLAAGMLIHSKGKHSRSARFVLAKLDNDGALLNVSDLPVTVGGEHSEVMLGMLFFEHYRSVWDFRQNQVVIYSH